MRGMHPQHYEPKFSGKMSQTVNVAIEGCCHGDLDRIYNVLGESEARRNIAADFMICCGDFQAIRTEFVDIIVSGLIFI